jgi:hypothetical protein
MLGSRIDAYMAAGMFSLSIGNNIEAGGENNVNFFSLYLLPGSTLEVDGKVLVDKGVLKF